jgi:hypothetical protein
VPLPLREAAPAGEGSPQQAREAASSIVQRTLSVHNMSHGVAASFGQGRRRFGKLSSERKSGMPRFEDGLTVGPWGRQGGQAPKSNPPYPPEFRREAGRAHADLLLKPTPGLEPGTPSLRVKR